MTPDQALKVLLAAAERALLAKQDHIAVEQAAKVLLEVIAPKAEEIQPVA